MMSRPRHVVVPRDLAPISTIDAASEVDPILLGVAKDGPANIWKSACALYRTGTQPAISLCVQRHGQTLVHRSIGHLRGGGPPGSDAPGTPPVLARPESRFCIFSISKAITAMMVHLLDAENALHLDDPVAEYIPEFGRRKKSSITIRHVLTHRAGIPSIAGKANDISLLADWDGIIRALSDAEPVTVPGRRLAYHAITGGYLLGEVVRRVARAGIRDVAKARIFDPLGLGSTSYGLVSGDDPRDVATNYATGHPPRGAARRLVRRALGVDFEDAVAISNDPRFLRAVVPAGNVYSTARDLATFFGALLDTDTTRAPVFDRKTVIRARTESSYFEIDLTLGLPVRYGLGFMLGGDAASPFGPHTPLAFGHYGFINVVGWADPERALSAALLTSGKPFLGLHIAQLWNLLRTIGRVVPRARFVDA